MNNQTEKINARIAIFAAVFIMAACCHKDITKETTTSAQKEDSTTTSIKIESRYDSTNVDSLIKYVTEIFNPVYDSTGKFVQTYVAKKVTYEKHAQQQQIIKLPKLEIAKAAKITSRNDSNSVSKKITPSSTSSSIGKMAICIILIIVLIYFYVVRKIK